MARSLPYPWIKANFIEILKPTNVAGKKKPFKNAPKIVQVINVNDENRVLFVNDTENSIAVFLTASVIDQLNGGAPGHKNLAEGDDAEESFSLKALKNSFIKLEEYHFTTVLQTAGSRDVKTFSGLNIDLPLAIQATRINLVAGHDLEVVGAPTSINKDDRVKEIFNASKYASLVESLASRQFPSKKQLPNDEGQFLLPPNYSEEYPLLLPHCVISAPQRQILDSIDTFDHSQIIKLQAEKKVRAKKSKVTRSSANESNAPPAPALEPVPVAEPVLSFAGSEETMNQLLDAVEKAKGSQKQLPTASESKGGQTRSKSSLAKAKPPQLVEVSTQDFLLTQDNLRELADILDSQVLLTQPFVSSPAKVVPPPASVTTNGQSNTASASKNSPSSSSNSNSSGTKAAASAHTFNASSQDEILTQEQHPPAQHSSSSFSGKTSSEYNFNMRKIGLKIAKNFPTHGWFDGEVMKYNHPNRIFHVEYVDRDREDISADNIQQHIDAYIQRQISDCVDDDIGEAGRNDSSAPVESPPKPAAPRPVVSRVFKKAGASLAPVASPVGEAPSVQRSLNENIRRNSASIMKDRTVNVQTMPAPPTVPRPTISSNKVATPSRNSKAISHPNTAAESSNKRRLEEAGSSLNTSRRRSYSPETDALLQKDLKKPRLSEIPQLSVPPCPRPQKNVPVIAAAVPKSIQRVPKPVIVGRVPKPIIVGRVPR